MRARWMFLMVAVLGGVQCAPALAQEPGAVEVGFDAGATIQFYEGGEDLTLGWPSSHIGTLPAIRAGLMLGHGSEIESSIGLLHVAQESRSPLTDLTWGVDYLYNPGAENAGVHPFVRVGTAMSLLSYAGDTRTQFAMGFGGGTRMPIARQLAVRLEGTFAYWFENAYFGNHLDGALTVGLSLFTK